MKEHQLQFDSAVLFLGTAKNNYLDGCLRKDWRAWHTPNGEQRPSRTSIGKDGKARRYCPDGSKLKRMGVLPGVTDWILVSPRGQIHFLELKRVGENLSESQKHFANWAFLNGIPYKIARTLAEVVNVAQRWDSLDPAIKIS